MKKKLLPILLAFFCGIFHSQAQITINSTDIIDAGDLVEQASDTLPTSITIGSGGANQTWDFSSLNEHSLDTLSFNNPSGLPGSSNFPSANIALIDSEEDSSWFYLNKSTSGLFGLGIALVEQGNLQVVDFPNTIITFPSTMGTTYSSNESSTLLTLALGVDPDGPGPLPTIDSTRVTRTTRLTSDIDGWGNVITPFGTFPSLRQIVIEEEIDSTWTFVGGTWSLIDPAVAMLLSLDPIEYDTSRSARWWTDDPSAKFPLVEMDYETDGTVQDVTWLKSSPTVSLEEPFKNSSEISLYPNPAKNEITVENSRIGNNSLEIFDISGKLIFNSTFNTNKVTLPVTELNNGTYFYQVHNNNGDVIHSDKFTVLK